MVYQKGRQPDQPHGGVRDHAPEAMVIERSSDPVQLLANIVQLSGVLASQWGEEIMLHLRVASLWSRIGKRDRAIEYLKNLVALHRVDAFNLGHNGVKFRIDCMRFFLVLIGVDETTISFTDMKERDHGNSWFRSKLVARFIPGLEMSTNLLNEQEELQIRDITQPPMTWLESVYLTPIPSDCKPSLAQQLRAIDEYGNRAEIEARLTKVIDQARGWHERRSDTPIWIHDLDDIGPRAMYLAVNIERPELVVAYLERCIDALHERPLALMPNVATAMGGLAYVARNKRRDDLLYRALEFLPRLPEHERCISAITLVEVLVERAGPTSSR